eukprot:scaffold197804_cov70-Attheya_sp.AAC.1
MSGYIRAIAAKLVLIDYMRTKTISGTNSDAYTNDELQGSVNKDIPEGEMIAHAKATSDELEFGLRCFPRAGRAILSHSPDAPTAYHLLSLSMSFWQAMISKDEESGKGMELTTKNFDEAFDSISFLPYASSLLGGGSAARSAWIFKFLHHSTCTIMTSLQVVCATMDQYFHPGCGCFPRSL